VKSIWKIFYALAILASLLVSCSCADESKENSDAQTQIIYGLDLSHHNKVHDWDSVSTGFIFFKATEGSDLVDSKFEEYRKAARSRGIKVGAYHFLTTASSATMQFKNFKNTVKKRDIDLIPVLDIERQTKGHTLSTKKLQQLIADWSVMCEEHYGVKPIIYTGVDFYRKYLDKSFEGHLMWFGDVNCSISFINSVPWDIWQYTIKHTPGIKGQIDHNVLNGKHKLEDIMIMSLSF